jgi:hypothetical protein
MSNNLNAPLVFSDVQPQYYNSNAPQVHYDKNGDEYILDGKFFMIFWGVMALCFIWCLPAFVVFLTLWLIVKRVKLTFCKQQSALIVHKYFAILHITHEKVTVPYEEIFDFEVVRVPNVHINGEMGGFVILKQKGSEAFQVSAIETLTKAAHIAIQLRHMLSSRVNRTPQ